MRTLIEWTDGAVQELRDAVRAAGRTLPRDRRAEPEPVQVPGLVPVYNAGAVDAPEGAMCEFGGLHANGVSLLAYRPRRSGLSAVGLWAGAVPVGTHGWAYTATGTVVRSLVLALARATEGRRIGSARDSFSGSVNPLGRFLVRGYDGDEAIVEITEPPVARKLIQLPDGQVASVREIEFGIEYDVVVGSAGVLTVVNAP